MRHALISLPPRAAILAVCALAFTLAACTECDLREEARALAGDDATQCGAVPLGEPSLDAHACTVEAFASGLGFYALFEEQGEDEVFVTAIVGNPEGEVWRLFHGDGGYSSAAATLIERSVCTEPTEKTVLESEHRRDGLPAEAVYMGCSSTSSYEVICED